MFGLLIRPSSGGDRKEPRAVTKSPPEKVTCLLLKALAYKTWWPVMTQVSMPIFSPPTEIPINLVSLSLRMHWPSYLSFQWPLRSSAVRIGV
ncbi:Inner kinetochore subunit wip1 [Fusarium oxysporum f. sp. albedinis]|nr:Inner kinetochore subunit wip1 [Fusarium oxysporum f. sp. albedinis]